jgi:hypothetical protein
LSRPAELLIDCNGTLLQLMRKIASLVQPTSSYVIHKFRVCEVSGRGAMSLRFRRVCADAAPSRARSGPLQKWSTPLRFCSSRPLQKSNAPLHFWDAPGERAAIDQGREVVGAVAVAAYSPPIMPTIFQAPVASLP